MADNFMESMSKSLGAWSEYVVPVAPKMMSGGIVTVEGKTDAELAMILDKLCGIDAFSIDGDLVQGVASRIQVTRRINGCYKPFNTFTIRESRSTGADTEWGKRVDAINSGYVFPRLTLQAYVTEWTDGRLLTMAVCFTKDLFEFLENHPEKAVRHYSDDDYGGKTSFVSVSWKDMINCGCVLRVLDQDGRATTYNYENIVESIDVESVVENAQECEGIGRFGGVPLSDVDIYSGAPGLYTVVITPDDAVELLINNTDNRAIKESVCQRYAQMMEGGQWDWCNGDDSKLMIGKGGILRNGQHRLRAQVISGVTGVYDVRTGVPIESYKTMDSGTVRRPSDFHAQRQYAQSVSALAKSVYHAACGFHGLTSGTTRAVAGTSDKLHQPTRVDIIDFTGEEYDDLIEIVKLANSIHNVIGKGSVAGIGTALYMMRSRGVAIDKFVEDMVSGDGGCAKSLNVLLKNLNSKDVSRGQTWWAGVIIFIANAWQNGRSIAIIKKPSLKLALDREIDRFHACYRYTGGRLERIG